MKNRMFHLLKASAFCILLAVLIGMISGVLERKESRAKLAPFFERAEDVDVLFLGNSHMLSAVYPLELWNEYGISGYNFGSYNNTIPVSYWTMRCALDVCRPELVVLDVDYVGKSEMLSGGSADVHTALDGFPLNVTKIQAIENLMNDPEVMDDYGNRYADLKWEFYFPLLIYHSRWANLTEDDFRLKENQMLGAHMSVNVAQPAEYSIIPDSADEVGHGFVYLRRIIEECKARGIEVLLVNVPFPAANDDDQRASNAVYYIAEEYGVDYIDFVYMDQIVDYATDCYDEASHMNPSGARKVTDYLGEYMSAVYGLEDHRNDANYASWNNDYSAYIDQKVQLLQEQNSLENFLMLLHDQDFSACVYLPERCKLYEDERLMRLLQNIGRRHLFEEDIYESIWADGLFPLEQLEKAAVDGEPYLCVIDRGMNLISEVCGYAQASMETSFGKLNYRVNKSSASLLLNDGEELTSCFDVGQENSSVQIAVIDERTGDVAMVRAFSIP